jgi:hypothetical protein
VELPYLGGGPQTHILTGTGSEETDYVFPLHVHRGTRSGDTGTSDVYMLDRCNTNFSDVYFTDRAGNTLSHYLHSYGNYETIPQEAIGDTSIILSNGKIIASRVDGITDGVAESTNNGQNWTEIYAPLGADEVQLVGVSALGYIFIHDGSLFRRSIDDGENWTTVIDALAVGGTAHFRPYGFAEAANGVLFAGRYQDTYDAALYRSLDDGATWEIIYTGGETEQHFHGVAIDLYTGLLYAGIDGSGRNTIRSANATDPETAAGDITFTKIMDSDFVQALFGDGWRMFSIENPVLNGSTIISTVLRTTDDITFTSEILTNLCGRVVRQVGNNIYLATSAQYNQRYPMILQRQNDETWKTIRTSLFDATAQNLGWRMAFGEGTPTGSENQLLVGHENSAGYKNLRLFDGGNHYQALYYVKIPTLPAAGEQINIHWNGSGVSTLDTFNDVTLAGLLGRWKLDEGTGTAITDISGNNKNGVLTSGLGGWNAAGIKRAGAEIPDIVLPGASYHFNGSRIEITGSDTDEDFQFTNNFTVLCWYKSTNSARQWLVGKGLVSGNNWSIRTQEGSGFLRFFYSQNASHDVAPYIPASDGGTHFVGVSISSDNKITWVVDGKDYAAVALDAPITANDGLVTIGADASGALPFVGDEDDIQIYNAALTAAQMRKIYEAR